MILDSQCGDCQCGEEQLQLSGFIWAGTRPRVGFKTPQLEKNQYQI